MTEEEMKTGMLEIAKEDAAEGFSETDGEIRSEKDAAVRRKTESDLEEEKKKKSRIQKKRKRFRLTGCLAAKIAAFFLLVFSLIGGIICVTACYLAVEEDMYISSRDEAILNALKGKTYGYAYRVYDNLQSGGEKTVREDLEGTNAEVAVLRPEDADFRDSSVFLWKSYEGSGFYSGLYDDVRFNWQMSDEEEQAAEYLIRVFYDPKFREQDETRLIFEICAALYDFRYEVILMAGGCILLAVCCFVFLMCSAGHKNGEEGIVPGVFTALHFDVLTAALLFLAFLAVWLLSELLPRLSDFEEIVVGSAICVLSGIVIIFYFMDFAIRVKLGKWWQHTLIYSAVNGGWRALRFLARGFWRLISKIPMVMTTVIVYLGLMIPEFLIIAWYCESEQIVLWGIYKLLVFLFVIYIAVVCRKLLEASRAMAEGREDYVVDTGRMFGAFREHGENLNSLGQGIARAVSERMKSEHMKTELITNVSHDLKTPLTSIINYAELICGEETSNPKIAEYSEVLLRQSGRLKRLLENLVEASKATAGNLEVNLQPCEVGVLLTQAVGEYQQRMEERSLELRDRQPEEPVRILADGRHLWRVFDNLLNNICKYAQENSRVYLSLEQKGDKVLIVFRNMSKYALNISPEELEERFVRGDKSRHMEGNGLGLSIAKSLTELQNGQMNIVIDGDLFKVTLTFPVL